jgi:hypothetical protein
MGKEFLSYSQSLSLKELGFDEPCFGYFDCERDFQFVPNKKKFLICEVSRPTFSQTFEWFRERYQIYPEILTDCTTYPKFCFTYTRFLGNPNDLTEQEWGWENNIGEYSLLYKTYEEAESACVDKLIEIVKNK